MTLARKKIVIIYMTIIFGVIFSYIAVDSIGPSVDSGGLSFQAERHVIEIENLSFKDSVLTVQEGDTIVWVNKDFVPHTATADDDSWDSESLNENKSWYLIAEKGKTDSYYCRFHPNMVAKFTVTD
ncbi:MAG: copper-binding protein [Balneolaceae bacterium]|nr:copper-binding protein [Balneolaceae bacterium]